MTYDHINNEAGARMRRECAPTAPCGCEHRWRKAQLVAGGEERVVAGGLGREWPGAGGQLEGGTRHSGHSGTQDMKEIVALKTLRGSTEDNVALCH